MPRSTLVESGSWPRRYALASSPVASVTAWLDRVDPGTNRRIKRLRLVTAFGLAWLVRDARWRRPRAPRPRLAYRHGGGLRTLGQRVGGSRHPRRDLALLVLAGVIGAGMVAGAAPLLAQPGWPGPELVLVSGAFFLGYLKRFGVLGTGLGSQLYTG